MEEPEYRVYIRVPIPRPAGFVDPPSFVWNAEKERMLWKTISRRTRGDINWNELAGLFQVDVPFLLQQAQFLYAKQLEELQLQMQRVNSSTSVLGQSKESGDSPKTSGQLDQPPSLQRPSIGLRPAPSPLVPGRSSSPRNPPTSPQQHVHPSFSHRKSSTTSSPLVPPDLRKSSEESISSDDIKSTSSAAALRLYREQEDEPREDEGDEEEPAFLPSSPRTSRPPTAGKDGPPTEESVMAGKGVTSPGNGGSDSFSDLSDASISKSALEEALEEHLRRGGSVAGSQMPASTAGGVRSIWKSKFTS